MKHRRTTVDETSAPRERDTRRIARVPRWQLAVGAVVLLACGLVLGGYVVTVTGISAKQSVQVVVSPSPVPVTPSPQPGVQGQVAIGSGCVKAIDQVQAIYQQLQVAGNAASRLDLSKLDQVVQRLQQMRVALGNNLGDCRATINLPNGSAGAGTGTGANAAATPNVTPVPSS